MSNSTALTIALDKLKKAIADKEARESKKETSNDKERADEKRAPRESVSSSTVDARKEGVGYSHTSFCFWHEPMYPVL